MKYFILALGLLLALAPCASADENSPPTGTAALLCKTSRHAELMTQTLSIDYDKQTVDDAPATFTSSMIIWDVKVGASTEHHQLNRITGTYAYWTDNQPPSETQPTFSCEKTPPKF